VSYIPSPAGFWKRYVAYFIDIVIVYVVVEILSVLFFSFRVNSQSDTLLELYNSLKTSADAGEATDPRILIETLQNVLLPSLIFSSCAYFILAGAYFCTMESSRHQATVGKRMLGIKVTNVSGAPIALGQSIARFLAASLSWITLNLGHAFVAWTPQRRALHDYIAGTRVENVDPQNPRMPVWGWLIVAAHALILIGGWVLFMFMGGVLMRQISAMGFFQANRIKRHNLKARLRYAYRGNLSDRSSAASLRS